MRTVVLFLAIILCSFSIAIADDGIPNLTLSEPQITGTQSKIPNAAVVEEDANGRAAKLDKKGDQDGTELTPVERKIVVRDSIITNAPTVGGN